MAHDNVFASTKQIWDIEENEAGSVGSKGSAPLEFTKEVGTDGVEFGTFINVDSTTGKVDKLNAADLFVHGIALIGNLADGFHERVYNDGDIAAIARREYFFVKIDSANAPAVGGSVFISTAASLEGYLTSVDDVNSSEAADGIEIVAVFDNVAEVFLDGKAKIAVVP